MAENNPAMKIADMKRVLLMGKDRPLQSAYGMTKAGMAVLFDLRRPPRQLEGQLKQSDPALQMPAFGTATRDPDDEQHLQFRVNKGVQGHAKRIAKSLRGTGIRKVTILLDQDILFETAEDNEDDADTPPTRPTTPLPPTQTQPTQTQPQPPPRPDRPLPGIPLPNTPPPGTQTQPPPDALTAHHLLNEAAAELKASALPPGQKIALVTALKGAQAAIDGNDIAGAIHTIGTVTNTLRQNPVTNDAPQPDSPPIPPSRMPPVPKTPPEQFADMLRGATPDLHAASAIQETGPFFAQERQALTAALTAIHGARTTNDPQAGMAAVTTARRAAVAIRGKQKILNEQRQVHAEMAGPLDRVLKTYLPDRAIESIQAEKLKPGRNFNAFLAALDEFKQDRSPETAQALENQARSYLKHWEADLSKFEKGNKENQRKKEICETMSKQARHLRMAMEMQQAGPPPWDEPTALKTANIRAGFSFESMGEKAQNLDAGEGGVSAAFWVKGWDDQSGDPGQSKKDFLFKPAAGEQAVEGFAKGDSAPREALAKALADRIGVMTGIDLGVPPTNVVTLPPESVDIGAYNAQFDPAMMNWEETQIDANAPSTGSLQQFAASTGSLRGRDDAFLASIPQSECEKGAVLDTLTLNTDRHPGNFMVRETQGPNGVQRGLIPIDHGLSLPSRAGFKARGPDRMNDVSGNVILRLPGAHQPFSEDMRQRIDMIDPDALAQGMTGSIDALDQAQPGLGAKTRVPPDAIDLMKRSARFLKLASRRLSPALIQIALATRQDDLLDGPDDAFDEAAEQVIRIYEPQAQAIAEFCTQIGSNRVIATELRTLGWHGLNVDFMNDLQAFKAYFMENATLLLDAYKNRTPYANQIPQPEVP